MSLLFFLFVICITFIGSGTNAKDTIVVFGGNGFVGRSICKQAIERSYRVIAVSRSGCPDIWKSDPWAQKVEWYTADALDIDSFKSYLSKQNPVAVFSMMGTLTHKQLTSSQDDIFEYAGTTNINVCNVAASIKSVKKFVYIGADVMNIGVKPENANNGYALWTQFWIGQYKAKLAVEQCVDTKFAQNGISFRPSIISGNERKEIFGTMLEFNRIPLYQVPFIRKFYKLMIPDLISVRELTEDALAFIENGNVAKFNAHHSRKEVAIEEMSPLKLMVLQNVDNIVLGVISVAVLFVLYIVRAACF